MRESVSPCLTVYSLAPVAGAGALAVAVAGAGAAAPPFGRAGRGRGRRHRCGGGGAAVGTGHRCGTRALGRAGRSGDHRGGAAVVVARHIAGGRIEQQREFTGQTTIGPVQLQDDVDERFLHRAVTGDPQIGATVSTAGQLHLGTGQHGVVIQTAGPVGLGVRHFQLQRSCFLGRQTGDVDLSAQSLPQRRLHRQLAQSQPPGRTCCETQSSHRSHLAQGKSRISACMFFQGVPQSNKRPLKLGPPVMTYCCCVTRAFGNARSVPAVENHNGGKHIRSVAEKDPE